MQLFSLARLVSAVCCVSAPPCRLCPFWHKDGRCPRLHCPDAHCAIDELDGPFVNRQLRRQLEANRDQRRKQREHKERQRQWEGKAETGTGTAVGGSDSDSAGASASASGGSSSRPAWLLSDDQQAEQRAVQLESSHSSSPRSLLLSWLNSAARVGAGYFLFKVPLGEDDYFSLLRLTLQLNGMHRCSRVDDEQCVLYWSISCPPPAVRAALRHPLCRILHFPHVQRVTHKDWLTYTISSQRQEAGNQRLYPYMPAAFALPEQLQHLIQAHRGLGGAVDERLESELQLLHAQWLRRGRMSKLKGQDDDQPGNSSTLGSSHFHSCHSVPPLHASVPSGERASPIWIIKPAHLGSGRGILLTELVHHSDAALKLLVDCVRDGGVAQRYIERPFLLDGYKCDVRLYALLLPRCTPRLPPARSECSERWRDFPFAVFVFEDGLIRLASQPYPTTAAAIVASLHSPLTHLTNNSINAAGNGGAASNRSFLHFMRSLQTAADESRRRLADSIERQVDECVLSSIASSSSYLRDGQDASYARHFELLGFDVLLDADGRLWLCEINSMPDLQCAPSAFSPLHPVDFQCKRRLLADVTNLLDLPAAAATHCQQHTHIDATAQPVDESKPTTQTGTLPLGGFRRVV